MFVGNGAIINARLEGDACLGADVEVVEALERGTLKFLMCSLRPLVDRTTDQEYFVELVRKVIGREVVETKSIGVKSLLDVLGSSPVVKKLAEEVPARKLSMGVRDAAAFVITTEAIGNCQFVAVASALAMKEAAKYSREVVGEGKPLVMPKRLRDITGVSSGSRLAARVLRRAAVDYLADPEAPDDIKMYLDVTTAQLGSPDGPDPTEEEVAARRQVYLSRMSKDTVWGDELTLLALSNVCDVVIEVYRHIGRYKADKMPDQPKLQLISSASPFNKTDSTETIRLFWDGKIVQGVEHAHYMPLVSAADRWAIPTSYSMSFSQVQSVADRIGFSAEPVDDIPPPEDSCEAVIPDDFLLGVERSLGGRFTDKAKEALCKVFGAMLSKVSYTAARFARHNDSSKKAGGWAGGYSDRVRVTGLDVAQALVLHAQVIHVEAASGEYDRKYRLPGNLLCNIHGRQGTLEADVDEILTPDWAQPVKP